MEVFKCKICGAPLDVSAGATICKCKFCGNTLTLPKTESASAKKLFIHANDLLRQCEFDKAEGVFEKILEEEYEEAEAYWGVILCKFGIEYVKDHKSGVYLPTCHRTSYESIKADQYYKKAIQYADEERRKLYERDAKIIDDIQKNILKISENEAPYDVFICYKETDSETLKRTRDSQIANEIYFQLTEAGYKVFFAAITLEDKIGEQYEPIIFSALNSAKVMLAIGTKPEYFEAVWVKNEWSRFLKMMKTDHQKHLYPCYRDMDPYDLPAEFAHLQAQDMSKIGFINDLIHGIKKVIPKNKPNKAT